MFFEDVFKKFDRETAAGALKNTGRTGVEQALGRESLSFMDFLFLLSPAGGNYLDEMSLKAAEITARHFGRNISMYIPVYLSNECVNECVYCGFHRNSGVPRKTLSAGEIKNEIDHVSSLGFRSVLLLTGESANHAPKEYLLEAVRTAVQKVPQVSLEVYPMDEKDYAVLVSAGVSGLTVYQETYDHKTYSAMHGRGPKKDFAYRMNTPDRALSGGMRKTGIGALLGLYEWRFEAALLGLHAQYLMKKYWKSEILVSFPRLRVSQAGFAPQLAVADKDLAQMTLALRLFLPRLGMTLSTREPREFRDNMIGLGITNMSAGSKTAPGDYTVNIETKAAGQFEIEDTRSVAEVADAIRARGYYPVFKDWDANFTGVKYESKT